MSLALCDVLEAVPALYVSYPLEMVFLWHQVSDWGPMGDAPLHVSGDGGAQR